MDKNSLSIYDDFLCHQTSLPLRQLASSDRNFQERVHFLAHDVDGDYIIEAGFGMYPNRNVIDGWCGISYRNEKTWYFRASRELRPDIDSISIGPLTYRIEEGLRKLRCTLDENAYGFRFDVTWEGTFPASDAEYHFERHRGRIVHDLSRFYQMGRPSGWFEIEGKRAEITPQRWRCHRDRSWGIRPWMPGGEDGMQPDDMKREGALYHFCYFQFDDWASVHHLVDDTNGNPVFLYGEVQQSLASGAQRDAIASIGHMTHFKDGTLEVTGGSVDITTDGGQSKKIKVERLPAMFPTSAIGGYPGGASKDGFKGWVQSKWMGPYWEDGGTIDYSDSAQYWSVIGLYDLSAASNATARRVWALSKSFPWDLTSPTRKRPELPASGDRIDGFTVLIYSKPEIPITQCQNLAGVIAMAVIPMWKVDRDDSMHTSKSEADKHDQMLEIGEHFATAVKAAAPEVSQAQAELIGLFLSKNRDAVVRLCKGSNDALAEVIAESAAGATSAGTSAAITPLRAAQ